VTGQVGHHHERTPQHANEEQVLARIVLGDLLAHLGELGIDVIGGDQGLDVHPASSLAETER
jgi:hypothetical protein